MFVLLLIGNLNFTKLFLFLKKIFFFKFGKKNMNLKLKKSKIQPPKPENLTLS